MKISQDLLQKLLAFLQDAGFGSDKADIKAIARELTRALAQAGAKPPVKDPERLMIRLIEHRPLERKDWEKVHQAYFLASLRHRWHLVQPRW